MSIFPSPPSINGKMEFCKEETFNEATVLAVKAVLQNIDSTFVPTVEQPVIDTHWRVSKYLNLPESEKVKGVPAINGTTCRFCLTYSNEEPIL